MEAVVTKKPRVLVAMSGGVDSSVAAAILVEQGYDVVGVTMQVWDYTNNACDIDQGNGTCCSSLDVDDARAVADHLGIPFYVVNCEKKFQVSVIDEFVSSYLEGKTPIPCVNCNTFLKFDHLVQKMKDLDCDFLATGHYAQNIKGEDGVHRIVTSEDGFKDQTYFLFTLEKDLLPKLMFPVGTWQKPMLREYAEKKGLPVAKKKDSTGICFIGKKGYQGFVEEHAAPDLFIPGALRQYPTGEKLGEHTGIHRFTYGQRKGLGIATGAPIFVVKTDAETGDVWLGEEKYLFSNTVRVKDVNLLDKLSDGEKLRVKVRYAHRGAEALLKQVDNEWIFEFTEPQRSITPGQAAVIYRENQLVGGGWIQ